MPEENIKYDVAISFLAEDLSIAQALFDKLNEGFDVFFFPRNQEELAGTDGLESMRAPFLKESRLNVVVYRPKWGKTRWTAVEEQAIIDSCLNNSYRSIFLYIVETTTVLPKWLPENHVYFSSANYTLDEAVGAIKARVQDRGGEFKPLTPSRKAELMRAENEFLAQRNYMLSYSGIPAIFAQVKKLFDEVCAHADAADSKANLDIRKQVTLQEHAAQQICTLTTDRVALVVYWYRPTRNSLHDAVLGVREFGCSLLTNIVTGPPNPLKEVHYIPDVSRGLHYGWTQKKSPKDFVSTSGLADQCLIRFLELIERDRDGKIRRPEVRPTVSRSGSGTPWS